MLLVDEVVEWFVDLTKNDPASADLIEDAVDRLASDGPALGRPLVDRIRGSRHHNMKELRPGSTGFSEVRILFAFDPVRRAVLLVAGDKSGNWRRWYDTAIPLADDRYDVHLAELETRNYE
ncbi:type II toxin-antitoxin system RelE/ParE family toxin [Phytohabitans aurantiacus]